jgi:hypothetical protein
MESVNDLQPFYDRVAAQVNGRGASLDLAIDRLIGALDDMGALAPENAAELAAAFAAELETVHAALPRFLADLGYLQRSAQIGSLGERHDPDVEEPSRLDYELLRAAAPVLLSAERRVRPVATGKSLRETLERLKSYVRRQAWRPEIVNRIPSSFPSPN